MKFGQWEHMDGGREFSPHREELPPPCQNGRHNLFWQIMYVGPVDAMDTVRDYGIFEVRECGRCLALQRRSILPETDQDVADLLRRIEIFDGRRP